MRKWDCCGIGARAIARSSLLIAMALLLEVSPAGAATGGAYCSATADALYRSCGNQVLDDYWTTVANCTNITESNERTTCSKDAGAARAEGNQLCSDQLATRRDGCNVIGEGRYDPDFDPSDFDSDVTRLAHPNRYFPLTIGNQWQYREGTEFNTVEVVNETKLIDGVTCLVVRDRVFDNGDLTEDTDDWYAQAKTGDVWYFGEETKTLESFDDDNPRRPELVSIDGSFKAERDFAKAGIIFLGAPAPGKAYFEEFSLGNAEDITVVLSTAYKYGVDRDLDRYVPRRLAELFCSAGDCAVTRNNSLLEPGIFDRKFYARGIGVFLEVHLDTGGSDVLVGCNFDPRCASLPVK